MTTPDSLIVPPRTFYVAGARPFILWVCAGAFAYTYLGYPLLLWLNLWLGTEQPPPPLGHEDLMLELVLTMLGLSGLRSWEKDRKLTQ